MNLCNLRAVFSSFVLVVSFNIVSLAEENVTKKPPEVFVRETIAQLKKAGKNLREKNFFKPVPPYPSRTTLEQYDNIVSNNIRQFDIIWKKVLSSCDPPNGYNNLGLSRKDKLELFLALLRELRGTIDPTFDASIPVEMNVFPEPDKSDDTGQFFLPGMLAEDIKHPKTRENYEKACWENAKNGFEELIHRRVNDLIPPTERVFRERIFKTYNVEPRADAELIELLEKYEYPMEARIKLLCELGIPYKGFRIWQSTDKLFKTTAKFISLNKGNVTLEKADGKHTTIEFSVLRQEDKDYVKAQPKAAPVAMRTWTSSGGKYHIQAKYVSADEHQVMLENAEGEVFPVDISKLSTNDQNYVKEQLEAKPVPVAMRTWTSRNGKHNTQAKYVSADENQVILKNAEGEVFPVDISKLSTNDQNYVKEQLEAKPELPKRGK